MPTPDAIVTSRLARRSCACLLTILAVATEKSSRSEAGEACEEWPISAARVAGNICASGWPSRRCAYNVAMLEAWLIGEKHGTTVLLFVECGMCRVRMPVEPEDDARSLLRAHLYCEHGAHVDDVDAS